MSELCSSCLFTWVQGWGSVFEVENNPAVCCKSTHACLEMSTTRKETSSLLPWHASLNPCPFWWERAVNQSASHTVQHLTWCILSLFSLWCNLCELLVFKEFRALPKLNQPMTYRSPGARVCGRRVYLRRGAFPPPPCSSTGEWEVSKGLTNKGVYFLQNDSL